MYTETRGSRRRLDRTQRIRQRLDQTLEDENQRERERENMKTREKERERETRVTARKRERERTRVWVTPWVWRPWLGHGVAGHDVTQRWVTARKRERERGSRRDPTLGHVVTQVGAGTLLKMKTREKERERERGSRRERERENAGLGHAVGLATMAGSRRDPTRVTT
jgi:hypothetical protein